MKACVLALCVLAAVATAVWAQTKCPGAPNTNALSTSAPVFLRSTTNGKLYLAGSGDAQFYVMHVYGTPYQWGYAHGSLLKDEINAFFAKFFAYVDTQIDPYLKDLPKELRDLIEKFGVQAALEATYLMTKRDTPAHFFDEMRGLADASGVSYQTVVNLMMFPEVRLLNPCVD